MKGALSILFFFYFFIGKAQKPELVIPSGHTDGVSSVSFSPDGKYILSGSRDRTVILWDTSGHQIKSFKHKLQVKNAVFSFDGNSIISTSSDGHINMAKLTDDTIQSKYIHNTYIGAVGFSPKSKLMVISNEENGSFELRDFEGKFIKSFKESKPIISFCFCRGWNQYFDRKFEFNCGVMEFSHKYKKSLSKAWY
ncbi:MAG: hypothetical protein IPO85_08670 [Saprospiraceae bacterium]|uniref:Serine-threonine kinase receptor-associated protein n=1 Tax=Candidatus Defluviibacterium haderslevense TaxID=2981993 RepID=A0A9D7S8Z4_9BACT|nr:hypothetical protein [Candidatus Defluviibacterium haderslevense]